MNPILKSIFKQRGTIALAVALLIIGLMAISAWNLGADNRHLLAERKALKAHERLIEKQTAAKIATAEADIQHRDKAILALRGELARKDGLIQSLSLHQSDLERDLAAAQSDAERVPILTALVTIWTEKFTLADAKCKDYEGIVFSLNGKIKSKDSIIEAWQERYAAALLTEQKSEEAIASLKSSLRRARLSSTAKTVIIATAGAWVVYKIVIPWIADVLRRDEKRIPQ